MKLPNILKTVGKALNPKPKVIVVNVFWSDALKEECYSVGTVNIPGSHQGYLHIEIEISAFWFLRFHTCQAVKIV